VYAAVLGTSEKMKNPSRPANVLKKVRRVSALTLDQYQRQVDGWVQSIGKGYFPPLSQLAQLTEEVGEVARVVNRTYGSQKAKPEDLEKDLGDEMAGVMFALACLANNTGIDLADALERHLAKITQRDKDRF
jgi:NTP pyrophosphatase (non-canonical NTP hydrolase)